MVEYQHLITVFLERKELGHTKVLGALTEYQKDSALRPTPT
jgi:hypothetical protein